MKTRRGKKRKRSSSSQDSDSHEKHEVGGERKKVGSSSRKGDETNRADRVLGRSAKKTDEEKEDETSHTGDDKCEEGDQTTDANEDGSKTGDDNVEDEEESNPMEVDRSDERKGSSKEWLTGEDMRIDLAAIRVPNTASTVEPAAPPQKALSEMDIKEVNVLVWSWKNEDLNLGDWMSVLCRLGECIKDDLQRLKIYEAVDVDMEMKRIMEADDINRLFNDFDQTNIIHVREICTRILREQADIEMRIQYHLQRKLLNRQNEGIKMGAEDNETVRKTKRDTKRASMQELTAARERMLSLKEKVGNLLTEAVRQVSDQLQAVQGDEACQRENEPDPSLTERVKATVTALQDVMVIFEKLRNTIDDNSGMTLPIQQPQSKEGAAKRSRKLDDSTEKPPAKKSREEHNVPTLECEETLLGDEDDDEETEVTFGPQEDAGLDIDVTDTELPEAAGSTRFVCIINDLKKQIQSARETTTITPNFLNFYEQEVDKMHIQWTEICKARRWEDQKEMENRLDSIRLQISADIGMWEMLARPKGTDSMIRIRPPSPPPAPSTPSASAGRLTAVVLKRGKNGEYNLAMDLERFPELRRWGVQAQVDMFDGLRQETADGREQIQEELESYSQLYNACIFAVRPDTHLCQVDLTCLADETDKDSPAEGCGQDEPDACVLPDLGDAETASLPTVEGDDVMTAEPTAEDKSVYETFKDARLVATSTDIVAEKDIDLMRSSYVPEELEVAIPSNTAEALENERATAPQESVRESADVMMSAVTADDKTSEKMSTQQTEEKTGDVTMSPETADSTDKKASLHETKEETEDVVISLDTARDKDADKVTTPWTTEDEAMKEISTHTAEDKTINEVESARQTEEAAGDVVMSSPDTAEEGDADKVTSQHQTGNTSQVLQGGAEDNAVSNTAEDRDSENVTFEEDQIVSMWQEHFQTLAGEVIPPVQHPSVTTAAEEETGGLREYSVKELLSKYGEFDSDTPQFLTRADPIAHVEEQIWLAVADQIETFFQTFWKQKKCVDNTTLLTMQSLCLMDFKFAFNESIEKELGQVGRLRKDLAQCQGEVLLEHLERPHPPGSLRRRQARVVQSLQSCLFLLAKLRREQAGIFSDTREVHSRGSSQRATSPSPSKVISIGMRLRVPKDSVTELFVE